MPKNSTGSFDKTSLDVNNAHTPEREKIVPRPLQGRPKLVQPVRENVHQHWFRSYKENEQELRDAEKCGWTPVIRDGKAVKVIDRANITNHLYQIDINLYQYIRKEIEKEAHAHMNAIRSDINNLNEHRNLARTYGQEISFTNVGAHDHNTIRITEQ